MGTSGRERVHRAEGGMATTGAVREGSLGVAAPGWSLRDGQDLTGLFRGGNELHPGQPSLTADVLWSICRQRGTLCGLSDRLPKRTG